MEKQNINDLLKKDSKLGKLQEAKTSGGSGGYGSSGGSGVPEQRKSTASAEPDRRLCDRLIQAVQEILDRRSKSQFDSASDAQNYHEETLKKVFFDCDMVLFDYARENPGLPGMYPDADAVLFSTRALGASQSVEHRMNFFGRLADGVDADAMKATGPFGELVKDLNALQSQAEYCPERATGCALIFFVMAAMDLLLFGPGLGLGLPDFFVTGIGTSALFGWGYGIVMVLSGFCLLLLLGTDDRYEKGLFKLLCGAELFLGVMAHGVATLAFLVFAKRVPMVLSMVGFVYYLVLAVSVVVSDENEVRKFSKKWRLEKMRQYCARWDKSGTTARRYLHLLQDWHRLAHPDHSRAQGVQGVEHIIKLIQARYDDYTRQLDKA